MKDLRQVMARFGASSVELLVLMLIVMTMLISLQGGDAKLVHDHHRDSYESLGPYFYHDVVNGTNVTDVIVVGGRGGTGFGALTVFDDPLTETPEINSTTVARSLGLQVVNSFDGQSALITQTVVFPNGTLSFTGAFITTLTINRFHCLGGTGAFQSVTHGYMDLTVYEFGPGFNSIMNVTMYLWGT